MQQSVRIQIIAQCSYKNSPISKITNLTQRPSRYFLHRPRYSQLCSTYCCHDNEGR